MIRVGVFAKRLAFFAVAMLGSCLAYLIGIGAFSYGFALRLESSWEPADPRTRTELESHLYYYSNRPIDPSRSMWGHGARLEPGQRMVQYLLLWSAPLDVIYDADDRVVRIWTSYE